ncbi:MAG: hypothetical protein ACOC8X_11805 [Chloroflexota bacterium]
MLRERLPDRLIIDRHDDGSLRVVERDQPPPVAQFAGPDDPFCGA